LMTYCERRKVMNPKLTRHAVLRLSQRGIRLADMEILDLLGSEVEGGAILLRKDAEAFECEAKRAISRVWRLVGKRSVRDGNTVITAYTRNQGQGAAAAPPGVGCSVNV
jgi:hypothetical protein